jgi:hypothetical protein
MAIPKLKIRRRQLGYKARSGIFISSKDRQIGFPYKGKNWRLTLAAFEPGGHTAPKSGRKEIIIEAASRAGAAKAHELLLQALALIGHEAIDNLDDFFIRDSNIRAFGNTRGSFRETMDITKACKLAAKASQKEYLAIALAKYYLSLQLCNIQVMDLKPGRTFSRVDNRLYRTVLQQAIVVSYSVIEELVVEVRADRDKPSVLEDGTWNPPILADLRERLTKKGMKLDRQFVWDIRGRETTLEKKKPRQIHKTAKPTPWQQPWVRDIEVGIEDAIAHLSWLRSTVSSHCSSSKIKLIRGLSVYDVTNGQLLARQLLLESVGMFDELTGEKPRAKSKRKRKIMRRRPK